jgi:hypothetical protein
MRALASGTRIATRYAKMFLDAASHALTDPFRLHNDKV